MQTEIHLKIVPDDSITETEIERLLLLAEQQGKSPAEFVAGVLKDVASKADIPVAIPA